MISYLGNNSYQKISEIIQEYHYKKVLLITNKTSFFKSGIANYVFQTLISCQYVQFNQFSVNPKFEEVLEGLKIVQDFNPDLIIGVGGGSAMDMAKFLMYFAGAKNLTKESFLKELANPIKQDQYLPLMLIPTTSGSGSEATRFAVIYVDGIKQSLDTIRILPDFCIVDGLMAEKLPKDVTAYTAVDALSQAIESYWAVSATTESKDYALMAIKLILNSIIPVVKNPTLFYREQMALGAYYAGAAINITRTTAPHAFSYYLTTKYHIPHGQAVGLVLPYFIEPNSKVRDLSEIYKLFGVTNALELKTAFIKTLDEIGMYQKLSDILKDDLVDFIHAVNIDRLNNNPAKMNFEDFQSLFSLSS
jgi:alcohol dehydrogenase